MIDTIYTHENASSCTFDIGELKEAPLTILKNLDEELRRRMRHGLNSRSYHEDGLTNSSVERRARLLEFERDAISWM